MSGWWYGKNGVCQIFADRAIKYVLNYKLRISVFRSKGMDNLLNSRNLMKQAVLSFFKKNILLTEHFKYK